LFVQNLLRYSVDIDLTYIPVRPRAESLVAIKDKLNEVKENIRTLIPGIVVREQQNKLLCARQGIFVKIEVNEVKRGVITDTVVLPLCEAARDIFGIFCEARIVPLSQLYGGKIVAALNRQHPRDLFDVKYMFDYIKTFEEIRQGFMFNLLSSDRPVIESLTPNLIDQGNTMNNQFAGMTAIPFSYGEYKKTRLQLIEYVNTSLTGKDKRFLVSFEEGAPEWEISDYTSFKDYPSIQWKLFNIKKLKESNLDKHGRAIEKLRKYFNF
jgi:hypothetical protein